VGHEAIEGEVSGERQFAEDVGRVFEGFGVSRMAGRVLGWLLICDPPRQTSGDLIAALGATKGSISTATRMLEAAGLADRIAVPGRRGDAFELRPEAFHQAHDQLGTMRVFRELMERGLAVLGDEKSPRADRLRRTRDFYAYLEREFPALVQRFLDQTGA
jgi:DNA-binding transcriptional regulator GbsR (MarR family)